MDGEIQRTTISGGNETIQRLEQENKELRTRVAELTKWNDNIACDRNQAEHDNALLLNSVVELGGQVKTLEDVKEHAMTDIVRLADENKERQNRLSTLEKERGNMDEIGRTAIFSGKVPRRQIAALLKVTPQWMEKAVRLLGLGKGRQGSRQFFTNEHIEVFRTAMLLRACNVSWEDIRGVRECQLNGVGETTFTKEVSGQLALLNSEVQKRIEFLISELEQFKHKPVQLITSGEQHENVHTGKKQVT